MHFYNCCIFRGKNPQQPLNQMYPASSISLSTYNKHKTEKGTVSHDVQRMQGKRDLQDILLLKMPITGLPLDVHATSAHLASCRGCWCWRCSGCHPATCCTSENPACAVSRRTTNSPDRPQATKQMHIWLSDEMHTWGMLRNFWETEYCIFVHFDRVVLANEYLINTSLSIHVLVLQWKNWLFNYSGALAYQTLFQIMSWHSWWRP